LPIINCLPPAQLDRRLLDFDCRVLTPHPRSISNHQSQISNVLAFDLNAAYRRHPRSQLAISD
jgi:hypothetical protein